MSLLSSRVTGAVASIRLTMPSSVTSRVFYPCQKRGVRIYRQPVAPSKQPVNTFTGADAFVKASSPRLDLVQSTPTKLRLPIFLNSLFPFNARDFSTCRVDLYRKAEYELVRLDPDAHRAYRDRVALSQLNRSINKPEVRQKLADYSRRNHAQRSASEDTYRKGRLLKSWLYHYSWIRDTLPWRSHQPLLFDKKVEHYCDECRLVRRGGLKFWWKSKSVLSTSASGEEQADSYLCPSCYISTRDWSAVMPQGYEDVDSLESLIAHKQQLDGAVAQSDFSKDDANLRSARIFGWCRHDWIRGLPWPTHQPRFFEQKAELRCTTCDRGKRMPMKLWWERPTGGYICNNCYTKSDWTEIMPKGYEDIRFRKDLVARKKRLDQVASGHTTTTSGTPSSDHHCGGPKRAQSTPNRPTVDDSANLSPSSSRKFSSTAIALITREEYAELRKDPERLERYRAERRHPSRERYRGLSPELRHFQIKKNQRYKKQRLKDDVEFRNRVNANQARWDAAHPMNRKLRHWCTNYAWLRERSLWKSYRPLVSDEKVQLHCDGCGLVKLQGLKFWWAQVTVDTKPHYLCSSCYYSSRDWIDVMPKGYEDVQTAKELMARKEQFDQSHTAGTNSAIPSSPLHSTFSRPGTNKASNNSSISSRSFSSTSANNGLSKAQYAALPLNLDASRAFSDERAAYKMEPYDEDAHRREQERQYDKVYHKSRKNDPAVVTPKLLDHLVRPYP